MVWYGNHASFKVARNIITVKRAESNQTYHTNCTEILKYNLSRTKQVTKPPPRTGPYYSIKTVVRKNQFRRRNITHGIRHMQILMQDYIKKKKNTYALTDRYSSLHQVINCRITNTESQSMVP